MNFRETGRLMVAASVVAGLTAGCGGSKASDQAATGDTTDPSASQSVPSETSTPSPEVTQLSSAPPQSITSSAQLCAAVDASSVRSATGIQASGLPIPLDPSTLDNGATGESCMWTTDVQTLSQSNVQVTLFHFPSAIVAKQVYSKSHNSASAVAGLTDGTVLSVARGPASDAFADGFTSTIGAKFGAYEVFFVHGNDELVVLANLKGESFDPSRGASVARLATSIADGLLAG